MAKTKRPTMKRREFMVRGPAAAIGAGLALKGLGSPLPARAAAGVSSASAAAAGTARVIEVVKPGAVAAGRKVSAEAAREMLRAGMKRLAGSDRPWAAFLKPSDRVGLKINTLGRPLLYTHHELIAAVVAELRDFGVSEDRIVVFDRFETQMRDCQPGFTFNPEGPGVRTYGTEALDPAVRRYDPDVVFVSENDESDQRDAGRTDCRLSSIFTKDVDKVVNMAILKDHRMSGVTVAMKNLAFGLCENNRRFHGPVTIQHFIADFNAHPMVRSKVVFHMADALEACYDQGPAPRNPKVIYSGDALYFSTDPVAMDALGAKLLNEKRVAEGLPTFEDAGRSYDHVRFAADLGLGVADLSKIEVERVDLPPAAARP